MRARAGLALLLLLALTGCTAERGDGPCLAWAKDYVNDHSVWTRYESERPNLPAIAVIETPDGLHAVVVVQIVHGKYVFVDNGCLTSGSLEPSEVNYWYRRRP